MKKTIMLTVMAFLLSQVWNSAIGQVQKMPKTVEEKGKKLELTRGANPNIINDKPESDEETAKLPKLVSPKESIHKIWVENHTKYGIDIFVNGNWTITIAPNVTDYLLFPDGPVILYATSLFKTIEWGPRSIQFKDDYLWKLTYTP